MYCWCFHWNCTRVQVYDRVDAGELVQHHYRLFTGASSSSSSSTFRCCRVFACTLKCDFVCSRCSAPFKSLLPSFFCPFCFAFFFPLFFFLSLILPSNDDSVQMWWCPTPSFLYTQRCLHYYGLIIYCCWHWWLLLWPPEEQSAIEFLSLSPALSQSVLCPPPPATANQFPERNRTDSLLLATFSYNFVFGSSSFLRVFVLFWRSLFPLTFGFVNF